MASMVSVVIHPSQFPAQVRRDLLDCLRTRQVHHKFHYESLKQSQKWLALHQAYSPSRTEEDCAATYDRSFAALAGQLAGRPLSLIGLGCGGGQKDSRLLKLLHDSGSQAGYTPVDVSLALVLLAREAASAAVPGVKCFPLVCDLGIAEDLPAALEQPTAGGAPDAPRLFTFFGMLPNFEPELILPRLSSLCRIGDRLLLSANLAPGSDYAAGVQQVLAQYDNELTRDWLLTFLLDLGVEKGDGDIRFLIQDVPMHGTWLKRIAAYFYFRKTRELELDGQRFLFAPGEPVRLFFSYRHTPALIHTLLSAHGLMVEQEWIMASGQEGVFAARQAGIRQR